MSNKYTGEVDIKIGNKNCKLVYDYRAIASYQTKFGKDANVNNFNIEEIVDTLLIGLAKNNPEITKDDIFDSSPAMAYVTDCIVEAFLYAQYGVDEARKIIDEATKAAEDVKKKLKKTT